MKNLIQILSNDDIIVVEISNSQIIKKQIENFDPSKILLNKSKIFFENVKENNPIFRPTDMSDNQWDEIVLEEIKRSPKYRVKVTDLDNNTNIVEVFSGIPLTVLNYKLLKKHQLKEIICATAFTPFGTHQVENID